MRLWRVILVVNLALAIGLMLGYLAWGRESARLAAELETARRQQTGAQFSSRPSQQRWILRQLGRNLDVVLEIRCD